MTGRSGGLNEGQQPPPPTPTPTPTPTVWLASSSPPLLQTSLLLASAGPPRLSTPGRACKNVPQPRGHHSHRGPLLYLRLIDALRAAADREEELRCWERGSSLLENTATREMRMCGAFFPPPCPCYCACTLVLTSLCTSALSLLPNCHSHTNNTALNKRQNKSTAAPNTQKNSNSIERND